MRQEWKCKCGRLKGRAQANEFCHEWHCRTYVRIRWSQGIGGMRQERKQTIRGELHQERPINAGSVFPAIDVSKKNRTYCTLENGEVVTKIQRSIPRDMHKTPDVYEYMTGTRDRRKLKDVDGLEDKEY